MNDLDRMVLGDERTASSSYKTVEVPGIERRDRTLGKTLPAREEYIFLVSGEANEWTVIAQPAYYNQERRPDDLESFVMHSTFKSARDAVHHAQGQIEGWEGLKRNYQRGLELKSQIKREWEEQRRLREEAAAKKEEETRAARRQRVERGEAEIMQGFQCPECEHIFEEEPETDPFYVCGNCSNSWQRSDTDSHKCEQCGKFAAKETETSCPECQSGVDEFEGVECIEEDGELVAV